MTTVKFLGIPVNSDGTPVTSKIWMGVDADGHMIIKNLPTTDPMKQDALWLENRHLVLSEDPSPMA